MAKEKENKTNAMRILDKNKINYEVNTYECDEFIDGVHIADMLGQPYEIQDACYGRKIQELLCICNPDST